MRIGIIGGAGRAGRALYNEAARRGDRPTAIVRDLKKAEGVLGEFGVFHVKDALRLEAADLASYDVLIDAMGTDPAKATQHMDVTRRLVQLVRDHGGPRLFFILGAGSLTKDGRPYLDELYDTPGTAQWIANAEQQVRQLRYLREVQDVTWTAVSPSAEFVAGPAMRPVLGEDDLLTDAAGTSRVSTGTLAVAVLDEIHEPQFTGRRFTVRDGER